jgi:RNA polymerase sigma-70 factor (ECF subfamily)
MEDRSLSPQIMKDGESLESGPMVQALAVGLSAWPGVAVTPAQFGRYLADHPGILDRATPPILEDIYLACACAEDVPGALRSFRDRFFPVVASAVRRLDDSPPFADEVYQRLCEVLFVDGASGSKKIARYEGQGPLAGFVGTAARRIALRLATSSARFHGEEALIQHFSQIPEYETTLLKVRHRETFNRALSVALRQLTRRERLILRMNLVERVSVTRIAAIYKVSQPTVTRWIQRSARRIFATVKSLVCEELQIDTRELESLLLLVRSQIEITLSQASGNGPPS